MMLISSACPAARCSLLPTIFPFHPRLSSVPSSEHSCQGSCPSGKSSQMRNARPIHRLQRLPNRRTVSLHACAFMRCLARHNTPLPVHTVQRKIAEKSQWLWRDRARHHRCFTEVELHFNPSLKGRGVACRRRGRRVERQASADTGTKRPC